MARLRYSNRKRLAETGTLGDLSHDTITEGLKSAISVAIEGANPQVREAFTDTFNRELIAHFGIGQRYHSYVAMEDVDDFLDLIENTRGASAEVVPEQC